MSDPTQREARLQWLFNWLSSSDPLPDHCDFVVGFGHFDLRIPRLCGELAQRRVTRRIVFTGGLGAGTANLGQPEADAFTSELRLNFPSASYERLLIENKSTNTAENIRFTRALLEQEFPPGRNSLDAKSAVLVVHSIRLRRVRQTWIKMMPEVIVSAVAPTTDLANERALYRSAGLSIEPQILGEIERLQKYAGLGWIEPIEIPPEVAGAYAALTGRS